MRLKRRNRKPLTSILHTDPLSVGEGIANLTTFPGLALARRAVAPILSTTEFFLSDFQGSTTLEYRQRELEKWLKAQPVEVGIVMAARAALRAIPLIFDNNRSTPERTSSFQSLAFAVFWATALSRVAAKYPTRVDEVRAAAARAAYAIASYNTRDIPYAIDPHCAYAIRIVDAAARAADARIGYIAARAVSLACSDTPDLLDSAWTFPIRESVFADAKAIESGRTPSQLASDPLWLEGWPKWVDDHWQRLLQALSQPHWNPWLGWYVRRIQGLENSPEIETLFAVLPVDPREKDPAEQNALLVAEIERLTKNETHITSENVLSETPELPQPGPAPRMVVQDEQLDLALHRQAHEPPLTKRSYALLGELREASRDFENTFDAQSNAHAQIRKVLRRYQDQVDLDDPDVDLIFALGLRLENAARAAERSIGDGFEPALEDSQQEALASVLQIHAVFIASDPDGVELLEAAERYAFRPADDTRFRESAEPVVADIGKTPALATERLVEVIQELLAKMGEGEYPARTGVVGRNTLQLALLKLAKDATTAVVAAVAGQIAIHTHMGQFVIANGAMFSDKAIAFFLNNAPDLRALAAVAPEGFGFLSRVIDWLKMKLEL